MRQQVSKRLPFTPEQLFALVGDVEAYPQFVPWITGMRTWNSRTDSQGVSWIDAEARVGFAFLRESFSTRVRRDLVACQIDVALLSGPFRTLRNQWRFQPDPDGTKVEFDIDFDFKSRMLDTMLAANLDQAVERLIACFEARARDIYGTP